MAKARNSSSVADGYFTEKELETLELRVAEIKLWKENAEKDQKEQPMYEMPKLTTRYFVLLRFIQRGGIFRVCIFYRNILVAS